MRRRAIPLLLLVSACIAPGAPVAVHTPPPVAEPLIPVAVRQLPHGAERVELAPNTMGITICTTEPMSWIKSGQKESDRLITEAHEEKHREQMREHPSCADYWTWVRGDMSRMLEVEAEAFCAGARKAVEVGRDHSLEEAIHTAGFNLVFYGFGVDLVQAKEVIRRQAGCTAANSTTLLR